MDFQPLYLRGPGDARRASVADELREEANLAQITVKFWRDIPAMVMVGRGRSAGKAPLPERFEQAIDRCAMKVGAKDDDAYLSEWRSEDRGPAALDDENDAKSVADRIAAEIDAAYDSARIKELISNDGWTSPRDAAADKDD